MVPLILGPALGSKLVTDSLDLVEERHRRFLQAERLSIL